LRVHCGVVACDGEDMQTGYFRKALQEARISAECDGGAIDERTAPKFLYLLQVGKDDLDDFIEIVCPGLLFTILKRLEVGEYVFVGQSEAHLAGANGSAHCHDVVTRGRVQPGGEEETSGSTCHGFQK